MGSINEKLKKLFKDSKVSQTEYARRTGASVAYVNHLIQGRRDPNFQDLQNIALVFPEVDFNALLHKKESFNIVAEPHEKYNKSNGWEALKYHLDCAKKQAAILETSQK